MAIKFQYNKTSLTNLGKQLKVRQKALPTLKRPTRRPARPSNYLQ